MSKRKGIPPEVYETWSKYSDDEEESPVEPCEDAISHDCDNCEKVTQAYFDGQYYADSLEAEPCEERPRGRWIDKWDNDYWYLTCSVCGEAEERNSKYCPNCGAQMESEVEA